MAWIPRAEALTRLKVKAQTLYAYVSRGHIRMRPDPADSWRSLYNADDIALIATRKARGRSPERIAASSMDWGEPALETEVSHINRGRLFYRGHDALTFASTAKLEDAAQLLWNCSDAPVFDASDHRPKDDAFALLAGLAAEGQPILGRSTDSLAREAAKIAALLAAVCGAEGGRDPVHQRLARGWGADGDTAEHLRQALVLMADHDLNASTFAARVAASTGASLPACLLAGLCTLSGPRHGGAGAAFQHMLSDARKVGVKEAVSAWLSRDRILPGFGHNLYPDGDPRAAAMLGNIDGPPEMMHMAAIVRDLTGLLPNCDFALSALATAHALPADAPFRIFLLGRAVGWCAHVMEQKEDGRLIRPRGRQRRARE